MSLFFSKLQQFSSPEPKRAHRNWLTHGTFPTSISENAKVLVIPETPDSLLQMLMLNPQQTVVVCSLEKWLEIELHFIAAASLNEDGMDTLFGLNQKGRRVFLYHQLKSELSRPAKNHWHAHEARIRKGIFQEDAIQSTLFGKPDNESQVSRLRHLFKENRFRKRLSEAHLRKKIFRSVTDNWKTLLSLQDAPKTAISNMQLKVKDLVDVEFLSNVDQRFGKRPVYFNGPTPHLKKLDIMRIEPSGLRDLLEKSTNRFESIVIDEQSHIGSRQTMCSAAKALTDDGWLLTWNRWSKLPAPEPLNLTVHPHQTEMSKNPFVQDIALWQKR